jgi:hypothetical protein
MEYENKLQ